MTAQCMHMRPLLDQKALSSVLMYEQQCAESLNPPVSYCLSDSTVD